MLIKGQKNYQDQFIQELNSQYLDFHQYNPKTKKKEKVLIQLGVSPLQMYVLGFPEEMRDTVLNTVLAGNMNGVPQESKKIKWLFAPIRKMLGLKPIKPFKTDTKLRMAPPEHMDLIAIGEKDDYWIEPDGTHVSKEKKSDLAWEGI